MMGKGRLMIGVFDNRPAGRRVKETGKVLQPHPTAAQNAGGGVKLLKRQRCAVHGHIAEQDNVGQGDQQKQIQLAALFHLHPGPQPEGFFV